MKRTILIMLIMMSWLLEIAAQDAADQQGGVSIRGVVRYENNTPAKHVLIELWSDGETTWRTFATTDDSGRFSTSAPCMVIQYKIEQPGYYPVYARFDNSLFPCRALESITLRAKPGTDIPGSEPAPTGIVDARIAAIPAEALKEFTAGQKAVKNDDYAGAIPHLQSAITLYPRYAEAFQLLGVAQLKLNQGPQAEASLTKAISIEDRMPQAQYLLGVLYAMTNRADLALKPLSRFAELDPKNPDAEFELAKVDFALNNFSEAEAHARKAIELKESNPGVHIVLGYALLRQKNAGAAKIEFQHFLDKAPQSPMAGDVKETLASLDRHANK